MEYVLLAVILAAIAYPILKGYRLGRGSETTVRTEGRVRGPGKYDFDIVGEAAYQEALEYIAGGRTADGVDLQRDALLYLDDENPHDSKAVRVVIEAKTVGYLARSDARAWRKQLTAQKAPLGNYYCAALIVGGWDRGLRDRGHFGVKLDLPVEPD